MDGVIWDDYPEFELEDAARVDRRDRQDAIRADGGAVRAACGAVSREGAGGWRGVGRRNGLLGAGVVANEEVQGIAEEGVEVEEEAEGV